MRSRSGQGGTIRPHTAQAGVSASLAPDDWRHIDASEAGARATEYLDAAAAAIAARAPQVAPVARRRSGGFGPGCRLRHRDRPPRDSRPRRDQRHDRRARSQHGDARADTSPPRWCVGEDSSHRGHRNGHRTGTRSLRRRAHRGVLMHISQPARHWPIPRRVTRPGGRIVVVEPDHRRLAVDTDVPDTWLGLATTFSRLVPNMGRPRIFKRLRARTDHHSRIEPMTHHRCTIGLHRTSPERAFSGPVE